MTALTGLPTYLSRTTRFPNGITNVAKGTSCENMMQEDPSRVCTYFDDFTGMPDIVATTPNGYTVTIVGTGTSRTADAAVAGGVLDIVTGTNNPSSVAIQTKTVIGVLNPTAKRTHIKTAFQIADITNSVIVIGAQVVNTTPSAANTEGAYLFKNSGAATGVIKVSNGTSTTTSKTAFTLVASTMMTVGIEIDPAGNDNSGNQSRVKIYINDVLNGDLTLPITNVGTTNVIAPVIYIGASTAAAQTLKVDYLLVAQER